jgi:Na+-driven multidrug efflux pump
MASRNTLDMTTGPIFRKLLLFAYPLMINTFVNTLYGTADKIIAGRFISDNAMAAIGAAEAPINLLINVFVGISSGVSISCGSLLGAKRTKDLRDCMHTALPAGFLCGLLVCILGLFFTRPLLQATNIPGEILSDASLYMLSISSNQPPSSKSIASHQHVLSFRRG